MPFSIGFADEIRQAISQIFKAAIDEMNALITRSGKRFDLFEKPVSMRTAIGNGVGGGAGATPRRSFSDGMKLGSQMMRRSDKLVSSAEMIGRLT